MIWDCQSTLATSGQGHRFFQLINLALVMIGVYGLRSLYFALIQEARIPILYTGTAVGLISILGFTPDIFMGPWMGYLLDNNPGAEGHHKVFAVLALFALLGLAASLIFISRTKSGNGLLYEID